MLFSGGLVPIYVTIAKMNLLNTMWALILPTAANVWFVILVLNFFRSIPKELEEAAFIDGAGHFRILFKIFLPISKPIAATIALFGMVNQWNSWFDAYIFVTKEHLLPLQNIIVRIINTNSLDSARAKASAGLQVLNRFNRVTAKSLNMSTMMISIIPIVLVYPFLQKYFIKGIMIGSVKG